MGSNRDQGGLSGLGDIIRGFGKLLGGITDIVEKDGFTRNFSGDLLSSKNQAGLNGKYDFSVKLGLDKGDVPGSLSKSGGLVPQTDIYRDTDRITVILDLPGADKASLKLRIDGDTLYIDAAGKAASYHKEIGLEGFSASADDIAVSENNGVYKILLKAACCDHDEG